MTMQFAFARLADGPAIVSADRVWRLADAWPTNTAAWRVSPADMAELFDRWDECIEVGWLVVDDLAGEPAGSLGTVDDVEFLAPVRASSTIYACGANYYDHVAEMGALPRNYADSPPFHFLIPRAALQRHRGEVMRPPGVKQLDWEAELAVIIGRPTDRIDAAHALSCVAGYTVANDVSCRDSDRVRSDIFGVNWLWSKGQRTLKPLGPTVVPAHFVPDPQRLQIRLTVDGELRQDSSTSQMIHSVAEQIAHLSRQAPLRPGDVILTGTPAGTAAAHGAYLDDGATVVAEIESVGRLENPVVAAAN